MPRSIHVPQIGHKAPIPLAARRGPLLCSSAIAGKDATDGHLPADARQQVANAFANLRAVLETAGGTLQHVVRLSVTLSDDALRDAVNTQWLAAFPDPDARPARHIAIAPLGHGMAVQLEATAWIAHD